MARNNLDRDYENSIIQIYKKGFYPTLQAPTQLALFRMMSPSRYSVEDVAGEVVLGHRKTKVFSFFFPYFLLSFWLIGSLSPTIL